MRYLALPLTRQPVASEIAQRTVHVPFDIRNIGPGEYLFHHAVDCLNNLGVRKIQHQLVPGKAGSTAFYVYAPVRVGTVKIGVGGNHFWLEPDPELHAEFIHFINEGLQPAFEFFFIHDPVAERAVVIVAFAEPAVVHDQHLDAESGRFSGYRQQLFGIEVEVCTLPVVDQDRPLFVPVRAPDKVIAVKVVECPRHTPYALV